MCQRLFSLGRVSHVDPLFSDLGQVTLLEQSQVWAKSTSYRPTLVSDDQHKLYPTIKNKVIILFLVFMTEQNVILRKVRVNADGRMEGLLTLTVALMILSQRQSE